MKRPPDPSTVGIADDSVQGPEDDLHSQETVVIPSDHEKALPGHYRLIEMLAEVREMAVRYQCDLRLTDN